MRPRSYLTAHLPSWAYRALRTCARVQPRRRRFHARAARIERALSIDGEPVVRSGPFQGMRYKRASVGSSLIPKLIGSYEFELHGALEKLIGEQKFKTIVDVGCAEGYYAVGLALRCPYVKVLAYDSSPRARKLCREMAVLNGVADRVTVLGGIRPHQLRHVVDAETLLLCDCEGYERTLIDPEVVPELAHVYAIVELHDFLHPGISALILDRCASFHDIEVISSQPREPSSVPALEHLPENDGSFALDEGRPGPMRWALMRPLA